MCASQNSILLLLGFRHPKPLVECGFSSWLKKKHREFSYKSSFLNVLGGGCVCVCVVYLAKTNQLAIGRSGKLNKGWMLVLSGHQWDYSLLNMHSSSRKRTSSNAPLFFRLVLTYAKLTNT